MIIDDIFALWWLTVHMTLVSFSPDLTCIRCQLLLTRLNRFGAEIFSTMFILSLSRYKLAKYWLSSLKESSFKLRPEFIFFLWQQVDHFHQAAVPMHLATLCDSQMISVYQVPALFIPNVENFLQYHYPLLETIINLSIPSEFEQFSLILDFDHVCSHVTDLARTEE